MGGDLGWLFMSTTVSRRSSVVLANRTSVLRCRPRLSTDSQKYRRVPAPGGDRGHRPLSFTPHAKMTIMSSTETIVGWRRSGTKSHKWASPRAPTQGFVQETTASARNYNKCVVVVYCCFFFFNRWLHRISRILAVLGYEGIKKATPVVLHPKRKSSAHSL